MRTGDLHAPDADSGKSSPDAGLEERAQSIVASAVELAEQGGFEAVRVRDIAAHAGVALGTLYKRFSSKEDILVAALEQEVGLLETFIQNNPPAGNTPLERIESFFRMITSGLTIRTKLSRAILRATATGDPLLSDKTGRFHGRMTKLMERSLLGTDEQRPPELEGLDDEDLHRLSFLMAQLWWAGLVGWMGGLFTLDEVIKQGADGGRLLLLGARASVEAKKAAKDAS